MTPVRHLREQAGLTQDLLTQRAGITQQTISRYETGRRSPTLKSLELLAEAVGLRVIVSFAPAETGDVNQPSTIDRARRPKYPYL